MVPLYFSFLVDEKILLRGRCCIVLGLRHNSQCKIIPIAALVVGLEGVVANTERAAVGKIGEVTADRAKAKIPDHGKDSSRRDNAITMAAQRTSCADFNL